MPCYEFQGVSPVVDALSFIHPTASLIGDVIVAAGCYIGPGASLRADFARIVIEEGSSVQDNATVHVSSEYDTVIQRGATIGHGAVIHGCEIGENCLIGINSVVLDGAVLGAECLVGALSLILHGMKVPERRLLIGSPARIVRTMSANEVTWRNDGDGAYQLLTREALASFREVEPMRQRQPKRESLRAPARPVRPNQS